MWVRVRRRLPVLAVALLACGGGPVGMFPGGALRGTVVEAPVGDWSFAEDYGTVDLETRPGDPYSVRVNFVVRDGRLYIDPAEGRTWYRNIVADPRVRVRFGDEVYSATAVLVTDPAELEGFDPDRKVYRLEGS